MLTDMLEEEEFEMKEDEPWYDKQDLEHDLQLAAELGKGLLERNRELKQSLQQMYTTNQEQLQEIEYLTKQVELVRQTNNQHVKMYEQLDSSSRELEQSNRLLLQNNKAAEQKIQRLTDTVSLLQTQVEELQHHVEDLKLSPHRETQRPPRSTRSVSCLQELHNTLRYDDGPDEHSDSLESSSVSWEEEEQASLRRSLHALQNQLATERALRDEAERETKLLAGEMSALEQQLSQLEGCQARLSELEHEAEELRQLWRSESSSRSSRPDIIHDLLPDSIFLNPEEDYEGEAGAVKLPLALRRWGSEQLLKAASKTPDGQDKIPDHECSCVRRAEVVKYRGISLLNEVDAQYSALQVKYDELLRRCRQGNPEEEEELDGQIHKSVQTTNLRTSSPTMTDVEDFHQPEYKELFRKIFSHIQKTKEDLVRNRSTRSSGETLHPLH